MVLTRSRATQGSAPDPMDATAMAPKANIPPKTASPTKRKASAASSPPTKIPKMDPDNETVDVNGPLDGTSAPLSNSHRNSNGDGTTAPPVLTPEATAAASTILPSSTAASTAAATTTTTTTLPAAVGDMISPSDAALLEAIKEPPPEEVPLPELSTVLSEPVVPNAVTANATATPPAPTAPSVSTIPALAPVSFSAVGVAHQPGVASTEEPLMHSLQESTLTNPLSSAAFVTPAVAPALASAHTAQLASTPTLPKHTFGSDFTPVGVPDSELQPQLPPQQQHNGSVSSTLVGIDTATGMAHSLEDATKAGDVTASKKPEGAVNPVKTFSTLA